MKNALTDDKNYKLWLADLKSKVRNARLKAAVAVNTQLLQFYWQLGAEIVAKQANAKWGDGFLSQLSRDLMAEFPEMKGFSRRNLELVRQWYLFYIKSPIIVQQPVAQIAKQPVSQSQNASIVQQSVGQLVQQPVAQLTRIPWGHNIAIISKCKTIEEALYYVQATITNGWSRSMLVHQMESGLYKRAGKAVNNFSATMPQPQSDLAQQTIKDPYTFDFLTLAEDARERDLEQGLIDHIQKFLVELGVGFAFVGRQTHLQVDGEDYYLDLLFYHLKLRCYVVIELKAGEFKPEYAGKMSFYLSAVDDTMRHPDDKPTIGLILCKSKKRLTVEYTLRDIRKPVGVSEYKLQRALPKDLRATLPSIQALEKELGAGNKKVVASF